MIAVSIRWNRTPLPLRDRFAVRFLAGGFASVAVVMANSPCVSPLKGVGQSRASCAGRSPPSVTGLFVASPKTRNALSGSLSLPYLFRTECVSFTDQLRREKISTEVCFAIEKYIFDATFLRICILKLRFRLLYVSALLHNSIRSKDVKGTECDASGLRNTTN